MFKIFKLILVFSFIGTLSWVGYRFALPFFESKNFPILPVGAYQGTISKLPGITEDTTTFYLEREGVSNLLTVVIFGVGWQPKQILIPGARAGVLMQNKTMDEIPWEPLVLTNANVNYTFTGKKSGDSFKGRIVSDNETEGTWELKKAPHLNNVSFQKSASLISWLDTKQEYVSLARELKAVSRFKESVEQQKGMVDELLSQPATLKERAQRTKSQLDSNIANLSQKNTQLNKEIGDLVSELGLIGRVSNQGKTIELARRVAKREARWYLANWADESSRGLEERLAEQLSIDSASLSSALKRAEEIYRLRLEISKETERIESLKAPKEPSSHDPELQDDEHKKERKNLWQRLFG